jgi:hypothetical protein
MHVELDESLKTLMIVHKNYKCIKSIVFFSFMKLVIKLLIVITCFLIYCFFVYNIVVLRPFHKYFLNHAVSTHFNSS